MEVRRLLLKILPYCASILSGLLFLFIGLELNQDLKGLFISIAAAFFAIPLIYLFYQQTSNLSQRKLNKEMIDFANFQIFGDILSILHQLHKAVHPLETAKLSQTIRDMQEFLTLDKDGIKEIMSNNEYLGFQVFKKWEVSVDNLHNATQNPYMLGILENEQMIAIIHIINERSFSTSSVLIRIM